MPLAFMFLASLLQRSLPITLNCTSLVSGSIFTLSIAPGAARIPCFISAPSKAGPAEQAQEISNEDFAAWKNDPVTKAFYRLLELDVELAEQTMSSMSGTAEEIGSNYLAYKGMIQACKNVLMLDEDDLNSIVEDEDES